MDESNKRVKAVALVPHPVSPEKVKWAWSYAVKHTGTPGEADYEAAVKLMMKRHPRWAVAMRMHRALTFVPVDLNAAEEDFIEIVHM